MGEIIHDATVALAFRLLTEAANEATLERDRSARSACRCARETRCATAWRNHVIATADQRIARLDAPTFEWPVVR